MAEDAAAIEKDQIYNPQESKPDFGPESEIQGLYSALQFVRKKARIFDPAGFGREEILEVHRRVVFDPLNSQKTGEVRKVRVRVGCTIKGEYREAAFEPADVHFLSEYFNEFSNEFFKKTQNLGANSSVENVIETASWAHQEFIKMHPFEDGNGRTARLLVDYVVMKARLPSMTDWGAKDDEYKEAVDASFRYNNPKIFKTFIATKILARLDGIKSQMDLKSLNIADFKKYARSRKAEVEKYLSL